MRDNSGGFPSGSGEGLGLQYRSHSVGDYAELAPNDGAGCLTYKNLFHFKDSVTMQSSYWPIDSNCGLILACRLPLCLVVCKQEAAWTRVLYKVVRANVRYSERQGGMGMRLCLRNTGFLDHMLAGLDVSCFLAVLQRRILNIPQASYW